MNTESRCELVSAAFVRAWARRKGLTVGLRGRLNPNVVEAFNKAHRVKYYAEPASL